MQTSILRILSVFIVGSMSACGPRYVQAPAPVDRGSYLVHIVTRPGETARSVARWYTGSDRPFREIAQISEVSEGGELKLGQRVLIPTFLVKKTNPPSAGSARPKSTKKGAPNKRPEAAVESDEVDTERDEVTAPEQLIPGAATTPPDTQAPPSGVGGTPTTTKPNLVEPDDAALNPVDVGGPNTTAPGSAKPGAAIGSAKSGPSPAGQQPAPAAPAKDEQKLRSAEDELLAALAASDTTIPAEGEKPAPTGPGRATPPAGGDKVQQPPAPSAPQAGSNQPAAADKPAPAGDAMESLEEMLRREQSEVQRLRDELKANSQ